MKQRCNNPKNAQFFRYGARGIAVCRRWLKFENFFADMGSKPSPKHSVERKDNNGPYAPDNCVWATMKEQSANKRNNVLITAFGKTMIMKEWAREVGINYQTISARLIAGWTPEIALTAPRKRGPRHEITKSIPT